MAKLYFYAKSVLVFFLIVSLVACSPLEESVSSSSSGSAFIKKRSPFQVISQNKNAIRALRRLIVKDIVVASGVNISSGSLEVFQKQLEDTASGRIGLSILGSSKANSLSDRLSGDGVLVVKLVSFREGVGSSIGSDMPAKVALNYVIKDLSGNIAWEASYLLDEKPLTDDLFDAKDRFDGNPSGGFRSAHALVAASIDQALTAFESSRESSFINSNNEAGVRSMENV